jgi:hypothetical protein
MRHDHFEQYFPSGKLDTAYMCNWCNTKSPTLEAFISHRAACLPSNSNRIDMTNIIQRWATIFGRPTLEELRRKWENIPGEEH